MRRPSNTNRPRRSRRGFTLVEVIVIVTIMALLVTVVSTTLVQKMGQAKSEIARTGAARLNQSLNSYLLDVGLSSPPSDFDFDKKEKFELTLELPLFRFFPLSS